MRSLVTIKITLIACGVCLIAGIVAGGSLSLRLFCPNTSKAIVKQLDTDAKDVKKIDKQEEIRYVTREKIKTVIKKVPDTSGCLDYPSPELYNSVLKSLNNERPKADSAR